MALWERAGYLYWAYELWAKEVNVRPMNRGASRKSFCHMAVITGEVTTFPRKGLAGSTTASG